MAEYVVCPHCHNPLSQNEWVKVVRCRDCESATDHCKGMDVYWCEYLSRYVGADMFCAWASRNESE